MPHPTLQEQLEELRREIRAKPTFDDTAQIAQDLRDLTARVTTLEGRLVAAVTAFYKAGD